MLRRRFCFTGAVHVDVAAGAKHGGYGRQGEPAANSISLGRGMKQRTLVSTHLPRRVWAR